MTALPLFTLFSSRWFEFSVCCRRSKDGDKFFKRESLFLFRFVGSAPLTGDGQTDEVMIRPL
jgi:hypothetical protein